jgi:hypothetical protein
VRRLRAFGVFWYDFIVGDDWRIALGVVMAFGITALLSYTGLPAWWLPPLAVVGLLGASLRRATAPARAQRAGTDSS